MTTETFDLSDHDSIIICDACGLPTECVVMCRTGHDNGLWLCADCYSDNIKEESNQCLK